jgi:nucleotide-binding universal stress UspA family protein
VPSLRWVIAGASGSPGSLRALRYAQQLARDLDAVLVPVLAWLPPGGDLADRRAPCEELRRLQAQDGRERLQDTLTLAWGQPPADLPVRPVIRRGRPGPVLATAASAPGDLLVTGAGRRGALTPDRSRPGQPLLPGPRPVPRPGHPAAAHPAQPPGSTGPDVPAPHAHRRPDLPG